VLSGSEAGPKLYQIEIGIRSFARQDLYPFQFA